MRLPRVLLPFIVTIALLGGGCGSNPPPDDSIVAPVAGDVVEEQPWTHETDSMACPETHPNALTVQAQHESELEFLAEIDACTDDAYSQTWIANRSVEVWRLYTPVGGEPLTRQGGSLATSTFRLANQQAGYPDDTMEPGVVVIVDAAPEDVSWLADATATGIYSQQAEFEEQLGELVRSNASEAFREGTRRRAMVTCGITAYELADTAADADSADSLAETINSVVDAGQGVSECRQAIREADTEQQRRGQIAGSVLDEHDAVPKTNWVTRLKAPIQRALQVATKVVPRI